MHDSNWICSRAKNLLKVYFICDLLLILSLCLSLSFFGFINLCILFVSRLFTLTRTVEHSKHHQFFPSSFRLFVFYDFAVLKTWWWCACNREGISLNTHTHTHTHTGERTRRVHDANKLKQLEISWHMWIVCAVWLSVLKISNKWIKMMPLRFGTQNEMLNNQKLNDNKHERRASTAFERGQIRATKSKCEMNKWNRASKRTTEIPKMVQQPNA